MQIKFGTKIIDFPSLTALKYFVEDNGDIALFMKNGQLTLQLSPREE